MELQKAAKIQTTHVRWNRIRNYNRKKIDLVWDSRQTRWCRPFRKVWLLRRFMERVLLCMNLADLLHLATYRDTYFKETITKTDLEAPTRWTMSSARQWMNLLRLPAASSLHNPTWALGQEHLELLWAQLRLKFRNKWVLLKRVRSRGRVQTSWISYRRLKNRSEYASAEGEAYSQFTLLISKLLSGQAHLLVKD